MFQEMRIFRLLEENKTLRNERPDGGPQRRCGLPMLDKLAKC